MLRSRRNRLRTAAVALIAAVVPIQAAFAAQPSGQDADAREGGVRYEVFHPDGRISLERAVGKEAAPAALAPAPKGKLVTFANNGNSANRLDIVFLGDGYTQAQMGDFTTAANRSWKALTTLEPFKTYAKYINGHRVETPSPVSGISNDAGKDKPKSTVLGMRFWCHGIERLLCADDDRARRYAKLAPAANQVVTIANSATYGGAGGGVTTVTGKNAFSDQVLTHEMGHSLGKLGDEYDTPYGVGGGEEPVYPNVTGYNAALMKKHNTKWTPWVGSNSPDGGKVGSYEGANYYSKGFFRPSSDSIMRTLGKQFNSPSREAMVKGIYEIVSPIDSATAAPAAGLKKGDKINITTLKPADNRLQIYWSLDNKYIDAAYGKTGVDTNTLPLVKGKWNGVTVVVRDTTNWVKDEAFRASQMTSTRSWWVWGG